MLITFGQLNTLHYRGNWGVGGLGPAWCPAPFTPTHACWVLTGLSGSGATLQGYRRSFFSVKGLVVALHGDHLRDLKIRLILRTQLCCRWGFGDKDQREAPPLPLTVGQQKCWAVFQVLYKIIQHSSVLQRSVIENGWRITFFFCSPRTTCYIIFLLFSLIVTGGMQFVHSLYKSSLFVMRHSLCIYANRGHLGENIL